MMKSNPGLTGLKTSRFARLMACFLVLAALPFAGQAGELTLNARVLGLTDGFLNYCAGVDSTAAAQLHEKLKLILRGASADEVAKIRGSAEYRTNYDSVTNFVGKVAQQNSKRVCSEAITNIK
jgi:hypothetical protein